MAEGLYRLACRDRGRGPGRYGSRRLEDRRQIFALSVRVPVRVGHRHGQALFGLRVGIPSRLAPQPPRSAERSRERVRSGRGARTGGGHRRRRRRDVHRVPPDRARLERRRPARPGGAHVRLDVPFGRARRPAAFEHDPDPDDDVRHRAVPAALGRDRGRRVVARSRLASARLDEGALRGAPAPGGLGEDVRAATRAHLGRGGAGKVPAHDARRRARRGLVAHRRLARPFRAGAGARGRCALPWRHDPPARAGRRDRRRGWPGPRRRGRGQGRRALDDRGRRRRQRRRHVRAGHRAHGRRHRADHPDGPPIPVHERHRGRRPEPADDARPGSAVLLPRGGRRAVHGRLRARPDALVARRHPARTSTTASSTRTGRGSSRSWRARSRACPPSPTPA